MRTIIGIDFDGTIADHLYPDIGEPVPGAFYWMKEFQKAGAKLVLWTMRSDETLDDAVKYCKERGIEFWGVNQNPEQHTWTSSPKAYCQIVIDDNMACCPMKINPRVGGRNYVDWDVVGPWVIDKINYRKER